MFSSNWVRFMGVLESLMLNGVREEDVVKVTRLRFPDGWTVSFDAILLTTVESDPDEAREMVLTAVTLLDTFGS